MNGETAKTLLVTIAAPVEAADCSTLQPEFVRIPDVTRLYGLKRGWIYDAINRGLIKSVCVRKPGNRLGVRLIHLQSIRDYLARQMEEQ